jgi:hypothetical protein
VCYAGSLQPFTHGRDGASALPAVWHNGKSAEAVLVCFAVPDGHKQATLRVNGKVCDRERH